MNNFENPVLVRNQQNFSCVNVDLKAENIYANTTYLDYNLIYQVTNYYLAKGRKINFRAIVKCVVELKNSFINCRCNLCSATSPNQV